MKAEAAAGGGSSGGAVTSRLQRGHSRDTASHKSTQPRWSTCRQPCSNMRYRRGISRSNTHTGCRRAQTCRVHYRASRTPHPRIGDARNVADSKKL